MLLLSLLEIFLVLALSLMASHAKNTDDQTIKLKFDEFKKTFAKDYSDTNQQSKRIKIYKQTLEKVTEFNSKANRINSTYKLELNAFSDLEYSEVVSLYTGYLPVKRADSGVKTLTLTEKIYAAFENPSIDWRTKNAVTAVKNQGRCGGCWAFATAGALEGYYAIQTNKLVDFSEQQIIDCSSNIKYGNYGCSGGYITNALYYVEKNGIMKESDYPYVGRKSACKYQSSKQLTKLGNYYAITSEQQLKSIVASAGPVMIAVYASENFINYASGIYDDPLCDQDPNHAVLVVGYGTENGIDFWLIKNSWGTSWGEKGYMRMVRNKNMCNIMFDAIYAVL